MCQKLLRRLEGANTADDNKTTDYLRMDSCESINETD